MRIAITGINSPLAQSLLITLKDQSEIIDIVGIDWKDYFGINLPNLSIFKGDIRNSGILIDIFKGCDVLIHCAFIVLPSIPDVVEIYDINIKGSQNVFDCAVLAGIKKIIYISSVAAYGFTSNNPFKIEESNPLYGKSNTNFYYAYSKAMVEEYLDKFELVHPEIVVTRFRPQIIIGTQFLSLTGNLNSIFRQLTAPSSLFWTIKSENSSKCVLQLTAEQDLVDAISLAISSTLHGSFNIAGEPIVLDELIPQYKKKLHKIPWKIAIAVVKLLTFRSKWKEVKQGWVFALKYAFVVDCHKLLAAGYSKQLVSTEKIIQNAVQLKYSSNQEKKI
jgi:nucleoside-diphosphate-sugar epimerase